MKPLGYYLTNFRLRNGLVVRIDGYVKGKLQASSHPDYSWDLWGGNGYEKGKWNTALDLMERLGV